MKVLFACFDQNIASSRLRAKIPQKELAKLGVERGNDVLIYGKHFLDEKQVEPFKTLIFDCCDDHFNHIELGPYYRKHIKMADKVTCNSEVMKSRIKAETGRDAVVIREPYESPELTPSIGPRLLWYGHKSNLIDIRRLEPELKHPLMILSNHPDYEEWSQELQQDALSYPCIVVIPTGKSQAKSENRMVEAIRCGKYVCAEYLPSYEVFTNYFDLGNIPEQIDRALANPQEAISRITEAQEFIRERYSPATIAGQWLEVLRDVNPNIR
jgi:hypothetical protein